MPSFKIDKAVLASVNVPKVSLDACSESKATMELTTNCGCGGTCLSSTT